MQNYQKNANRQEEAVKKTPAIHGDAEKTTGRGIKPRPALIESILRRNGLPDNDEFLSRTIHLVTLLDAECLKERSEVAQRYVNAVFAE